MASGEEGSRSLGEPGVHLLAGLPGYHAEAAPPPPPRPPQTPDPRDEEGLGHLPRSLPRAQKAPGRMGGPRWKPVQTRLTALRKRLPGNPRFTLKDENHEGATRRGRFHYKNEYSLFPNVCEDTKARSQQLSVS